MIYLRSASNLGANGNYRKCLTLATAPHLVVMGADDVMLPEHLEVVMDVFSSNPQAAVVQTGVQVIDEHGDVRHPLGDRMKVVDGPSRRKRTPLTGEDMAVSQPTACSVETGPIFRPCMGWRTNVIRSIGFREDLDVVQDLALLLDVATAGNTLVFDPRLAFQYRRHSESDSSVRALDGRRFDEEREFFGQEARRFQQLGWIRLDTGCPGSPMAHFLPTQCAVAATQGRADPRVERDGPARPTRGRLTIGRHHAESSSLAELRPRNSQRKLQLARLPAWRRTLTSWFPPLATAR